MNEVANPCCGSCKLWNDNTQICREHNEYCQGSHLNCEGEDYSPRNPAPLIDVPGVGELVEAAWRAGCRKGMFIGNCSSVVQKQRAFDQYMKALEAGK